MRRIYVSSYLAFVATEQEWEAARLANEEFHRERVERLRATTDMSAPWEAFPQIPRFSIGWRMGESESYWNDWLTWLRGCSPAQREAYRQKHPETDAWLGTYANHFSKFGEIEKNWDLYWDAELEQAKKRFAEWRRIASRS